jgi:hypothetical protein
MPQRFYAFATGNNHANLATVFAVAVADAGDTVVWLSTAAATAKGWADGSNEVLKARGIGSEVIVVTPDEEFAPAGKLLADIGNHPGDEPVFVLTGGQKLTALAFESAAASLDNRPVALYADLDQARLLRRDPASDEFRTASWGSAPFTLSELLQSRGLEIRRSKKSPADQIWPRPSGALPADPLEAFRTNATLRQLVLRLYSTATLQRTVDGEEIKVPELFEFVRGNPRQLENWANRVRQHVRNPRVADWLVAPDHGFLSSMAGFFREQANYALKNPGEAPVSSDQEKLLREEGWIDGALTGGAVRSHNLKAPLGDRFEAAVAARLLRFLQKDPALAAPFAAFGETWRFISAEPAPR